MVVTVAAMALALVLAACSSTAFAARVDDLTITVEDLEAELRAIAANEVYLRSIEDRIQVLGSGQGSFDAAFTAQVLTRQIVYGLLSETLEARGIEVTLGDLEKARPRVAEQAGGEEVLSAFSDRYQNVLVTRAAMVDLLILALSDLGTGEDAALAYYRAHPEEFAEACVSHILLGSPEAVPVARERLDAGEPFASVALEMSRDTQSAVRGGELGCDITPDTEFVPEFLSAVFAQPVNTVGEPVETPFGIHLIMVTSREVPPFEEVADRALGKAVEAGERQLQEFVGAAIDAATIEVNPRFGTFRKAGPDSAVVPPQAPEAETATSTDTTMPAGDPGPLQPVP